MAAWRGLAGGLTAVVLVLSACEAGPGDAPPSSTDQLEYYGIGHRLCIPGEPPTGAVGFDVFVNRGPGEVRVDRVVWENLSGLEILAVRVDERRPGDLAFSFGMAPGAPEQWAGSQGVGRKTGRWQQQVWRRAVPAEGASLPVTDESDESWLTFVIRYRGTRGKAGPLRVEYTDAVGNTGVATSDVRITVRRTC